MKRVSAPMAALSILMGSCLSVAVLASGSAAATGSTSPVWSVQSTSNPTAANGQLSGVKCTSPSSCTAVGSYRTPAGRTATLAESLVDGHWVQQPTPNPVGSADAQLAAVSCTSASDCVAVGHSSLVLPNSESDDALIENWNGAKWAIDPVPLPAGAAASELAAVSCISATACVAVGYWENTLGVQLNLGEAWDGKTWQVTPVANPRSGWMSQLTGVACTSAKACTAVGHYENKLTSVTDTLGETWNGKTWVIAATPNVPGDPSFLVGVSCSAVAACTAVGYSTLYTSATALVERWNGSAWARQTTPSPVGSTLHGVFCTSATRCVAVGESSSSGLIETWNGASWTTQSVPAPPGAESYSLSSVKCVPPDTCMAVGSYKNSDGIDLTLAEAWNGTSWLIEPTVNPSGALGSGLAGLSCTSADFCEAVGELAQTDEGNQSSEVPLAEVWNGKTWARQAIPPPAGVETSALNGVSCASPVFCVAVGTYNAHDWLLAFAEVWNGTAWSSESLPVLVTAPENMYWLNGVTCLSSKNCIAVGGDSSGDTGTGGAYSENWNGKAWTPETAPGLYAGDDYGEFLAVSCVSATDCIGVGTDNGLSSTPAIADKWNGSSWVAEEPVSPNLYDSLSGVSCLPSGGCVAVGVEGDGYEIPLVETLNATGKWTVIANPPATAFGSSLSAVSCTSTANCVAVGAYPAGTIERPYGESLSGNTWTVEHPATPAGTPDGYLSAIVCSSSGCEAVGSANGVTLAERRTT
jgi:hypothetical protein